MKFTTKLGLAPCTLMLLSSVVLADTSVTFIDNVKVVNGTQALSYEQADVIVAGGIIRELGADLTVPRGAEVIDGEGKTLTHGFFNAETQLGVTEVGAVSGTRDDSSEDLRISASFDPLDAFNRHSTVIPYNRMHGITHSLLVPVPDGHIFSGLASVVDLSQRADGLKAHAAVTVVLGEYGARLSGGSRATSIAQLEEALEDARHYQANQNAYQNGAVRDYSLSRRDLAALAPVVEGELPLLTYVERAADIEHVLRIAQEQNVKVILAGASEAWRVKEQIAAANVAVVLDPIRNLPTSYEAIGSRLDNAQLLQQAGVRLLFTGMGWQNTHNAYLVRQSAGNAVANGLGYHAAIAAITSNPAAEFNLSGGGLVQPGAPASLVLWDGDPLEVTTLAQWVMIDGESRPLVSRATRLRDRYFDRINAQK